MGPRGRRIVAMENVIGLVVDVKVDVVNNQGFWDAAMMGDYIWCLTQETEYREKKKEPAFFPNIFI